MGGAGPASKRRKVGEGARRSAPVFKKPRQPSAVDCARGFVFRPLMRGNHPAARPVSDLVENFVYRPPNAMAGARPAGGLVQAEGGAT